MSQGQRTDALCRSPPQTVRHRDESLARREFYGNGGRARSETMSHHCEPRRARPRRRPGRPLHRQVGLRAGRRARRASPTRTHAGPHVSPASRRAGDGRTDARICGASSRQATGTEACGLGPHRGQRRSGVFAAEYRASGAHRLSEVSSSRSQSQREKCPHSRASQAGGVGRFAPCSGCLSSIAHLLHWLRVSGLARPLRA